MPTSLGVTAFSKTGSRANDGVVKPPRYLPPTFRDLNGLAIWMSYSTFFTRLGGTKVSEHYGRIFSKGASSG